MDWSEHHVILQPLARDLYEAMNLGDWGKAVELSEKLLSTASRLHAAAHIEKQRTGRRTY